MSLKPISRRQILAGAAVAVPIGAASLLAPAEAYASDEPAGSRVEDVVTRYFGILNAGMASTNADFSALASVYANKAVLTQSSPAGVTHVYEGLDAVTYVTSRAQWCSATSMPVDPARPNRGSAPTYSRCAVAASAASTGLPTTRVFRDSQMSQEGNDNHKNGPTGQCRDMALPTPLTVLPAPLCCQGVGCRALRWWVFRVGDGACSVGGAGPGSG
jgi:hypothetical protein